MDAAPAPATAAGSVVSGKEGAHEGEGAGVDMAQMLLSAATTQPNVDGSSGSGSGQGRYVRMCSIDLRDLALLLCYPSFMTPHNTK